MYSKYLKIGITRKKTGIIILHQKYKVCSAESGISFYLVPIRQHIWYMINLSVTLINIAMIPRVLGNNLNVKRDKKEKSL